jgi:hypothetical protein
MAETTRTSKTLTVCQTTCRGSQHRPSVATAGSMKTISISETSEIKSHIYTVPSPQDRINSFGAVKKYTPVQILTMILQKQLNGYRSRKSRLTTVGIRCADHATSSIRKSWHCFANKGRSLGRHSSLAD